MYLTEMLSDRRMFLKWIGALPTLAAFTAEDLMAKAQKAVRHNGKENIYTRIGVTPIINARGTWTYTSASLELPEVKAAKQEAALHFVDMWELERGVGARLAELSGAESGMVTAGAAAHGDGHRRMPCGNRSRQSLAASRYHWHEA